MVYKRMQRRKRNCGFQQVICFFSILWHSLCTYLKFRIDGPWTTSCYFMGSYCPSLFITHRDIGLSLHYLLRIICFQLRILSLVLWSMRILKHTDKISQLYCRLFLILQCFHFRRYKQQPQASLVKGSLQASQVDGRVRCSFTRIKDFSSPLTKGQTYNLTQNFYLFIANGSASGGKFFHLY